FSNQAPSDNSSRLSLVCATNSLTVTGWHPFIKTRQKPTTALSQRKVPVAEFLRIRLRPTRHSKCDKALPPLAQQWLKVGEVIQQQVGLGNCQLLPRVPTGGHRGHLRPNCS